ncbi:response regulator [Paenibacillus psychroresistens]|uniref:Response regulator n=1 Tax=Paenibacillus psychroresistens TaxID=1778678 RepID=A0A6B8RHK1_9BACL|nr:response regulator [Paenibacillus psychroresistens]QGQ95013.1 response regulator [Paenibacillus psychroresistens]
MYNLLVVDDEVMVRIGIVNCINWTENQFAPPLEASNGEEAWELIQREKIDIVLTDIRMPGMDGLELLKVIHENNKQTEVIMLSCHNDFEYVRGALELGACDYLFKPAMLPEDILKSILKAVHKLNDRVQLDGRVKKLEEQIEAIIPKIKEDYLLDIINGKKTNLLDFQAKADELNITFSTEPTVLLLIKINNISDVLANKYKDAAYLLKFSVLNIVAENLQAYPHCEIISKQTDEYMVIFSHGGENTKKTYARVSAIGKNIIESLNQYLSLVITIGVSKADHTPENLKTAYEESCYSVDKRFMLGTLRTIFYEDSVEERKMSSLELRSLLDSLHHHDEPNYQGKIANLFQGLRANSFVELSIALEISANIISILFKKVENEGVIEAVYAAEPEIYSKLFTFRHMDEMEQFLLQIAELIQNRIQGIHRKEIQMALKYMEENLGDIDINLGTVANHVNISRNYFSRLFKETTGNNFIDHLTEMRIRKAEKLYRTTELKIYQISELVGYPDWRYFSKVYKKHKGKQLSSIRR